MSREDRKGTPAVRFKGFTDAWEQRRLGEYGSVSMNKRIFKNQTAESGDIPFYKIGTFGGVPDAYISRDLYEEYKKKYSYPKKGDVLISASGSIGRTVVYDGEEAYYQDSNIVWLNHDSRLDDSFLLYVYAIVKWSGIEGSTISRLYNENILSTQVMIPVIEEQRKIGEILSKVDTFITLQQRKLSKLQDLKKALLAKMFPADGETVPAVRFKGFTEAWEQRKLGELMPVGSVKRVHQEDWRQSGIRFLRARDIVAELKNEEVEDKLYISENQYDEYTRISGKVAENDLLVTGVGTIGAPYRVKDDKPLYFKDGNIIWFKNSNVIDGRFFFYSFLGKTIQNHISNSAGVGTVGTYTIESGKDTPIFLPSHDEQESIGLFFERIDTLITLHQRKLSKLKDIKKALLNNMFPGGEI